VKVKMRCEGLFVVGGIRDVDAFDGALVGEWAGEDLHYRGIVEWGFNSPDVLALLHEAKHSRQRLSPFVNLPRMPGAVWLAPRLRAEIPTPTWRPGNCAHPRGEGSYVADSRGFTHIGGARAHTPQRAAVSHTDHSRQIG
jgi:hypothetical protein